MSTIDISRLVILRVLSVSTIFTEENATSVRNCRQNAALLLKWEGETEYICNGVCVHSNATHPVLLPKGSCYSWRCLCKGRYTVVEFDTDFVSEEIIGFCISDSEKMRQKMQKLEFESLQKTTYWHLKACKEVYGMLLALLSATEGTSGYIPTDKLQKIKPAVDYMTEHYNEPLSNDLLADMTGVSTVYFRKLFTAAYGISPIHHLHRIRVRKAIEMLGSDYGTLANVATSVGYPNVFHFSKMFKSIVGVSPGAYAKGKSALKDP